MMVLRERLPPLEMTDLDVLQDPSDQQLDGVGCLFRKTQAVICNGGVTVSDLLTSLVNKSKLFFPKT